MNQIIKNSVVLPRNPTWQPKHLPELLATRIRFPSLMLLKLGASSLNNYCDQRKLDSIIKFNFYYNSLTVTASDDPHALCTSSTFVGRLLKETSNDMYLQRNANVYFCIQIYIKYSHCVWIFAHLYQRLLFKCFHQDKSHV